MNKNAIHDAFDRRCFWGNIITVLGLLILWAPLAGCGNGPAFDAWESESLSRGWEKDELHQIRAGDLATYECGCTWRVSPMGGVFGSLPLAPPRLCLSHDKPIINISRPKPPTFTDEPKEPTT